MKILYRAGLILVSVLLLVLSLLVAEWGESWASIGLVYVLRISLPLVTLSALVSLGFGIVSQRRLAVAPSGNQPSAGTRLVVLDTSAILICLAAWFICLHALETWFGEAHTQ